MSSKYINIHYPFQDSHKGFFLDMNSIDSQAIKSDLLHLILTRRGQRLYNPDFGTDLLKFIFEPQDGLTLNDIKTDISTVVSRYLPNLKIDELSIDNSVDDNHASIVTLKYTVTEGVYSTQDIVTINV